MRFTMSEMRQVLEGSSRLNQMTKEIKHIYSIIRRVFEKSQYAKSNPVHGWARDRRDKWYNIREKQFRCVAPDGAEAIYGARAQIVDKKRVCTPKIWLELPPNMPTLGIDQKAFALDDPPPRQLVSLIHATLPSLVEQLASSFPNLEDELKFWMETAQK